MLLSGCSINNSVRLNNPYIDCGRRGCCYHLQNNENLDICGVPYRNGGQFYFSYPLK